MRYKNISINILKVPAVLVGLSVSLASGALAQSSPAFSPGQTLTSSSLNAAFQAKADATVTGPYTGQVAQTQAQQFNSVPINMFTYLTAANQAKVRAGTATTSDFDLKTLIGYAMGAATYNNFATPRIYLPEGVWPSTCDWQLKKDTFIEGAGAGGGLAGIAAATIIDMGTCTTTPGITFNRYNTLNGGTVGGTTGADGTVLANLQIKGEGTWSGSTDPLANPAIYGRARFTLRNVGIDWPGGTAIKVLAYSGAGGSTEGAANEFRIETVNVLQAGAYGLYIEGNDTNRATITAFGVQQSGLACSVDRSFLGTLWDTHCDGPGTAGKGVVAYGGHKYTYIKITAGNGADVTPGTDNTVWYDMGTGTGTAWSNTGTYYPSSCFYSDNPNARSVWLAPYCEGASVNHINTPAMAIGGQGTYTPLTAHMEVIQGLGSFFSNAGGFGGYQGLTLGDARGTFDYSYMAHDGAHISAQAYTGSEWRIGPDTGQLGWVDFQWAGLGSGKALILTSNQTSGYKFGRTTDCFYCAAIDRLILGTYGSPVVMTTTTSNPATTGEVAGSRYFNASPTPTGVDKWVVQTQGSPDTIFSDYVYPRANSATDWFGPVTGAGGAVTQVTSRTTGVTINKPSFDLTLVSAAGSATPFTLTVTNSIVGAKDTPYCVEQSGTDKYLAYPTSVSAGAFNLTVEDRTGTTTETPVLHCTIISGANS